MVLYIKNTIIGGIMLKLIKEIFFKKNSVPTRQEVTKIVMNSRKFNSPKAKRGNSNNRYWICMMYASGCSISEISKDLNVSCESIEYTLNAVMMEHRSK